MGRRLSPFVQEFFTSRAGLDSRVYNTQIGLEIAVRGGGEPLLLGSAPFVMSSLSRKGASVALGAPVQFADRIATVPDLFFSQDDTQSDGSGVFELINLDYVFSALIPETSRLLTKAGVTVYLCFPKPDGTFEGVVHNKGYLRLADGDDQTARLSFVSDLSERTATAGGKELTQRCVNILGVNSGRSWCGADVTEPEFYCSKLFDDAVAGCAFYGQESQFNAVPFFNPNTAPPNYGGGNISTGGVDIIGGGGGWDDPQPNCVAVESWLRAGNGQPVRGTDLHAGDTLQDHLGRVVIIEKIEPVFAEYRYRLTTSSGAQLVCTPLHPLLTSLQDPKGTPAMRLIYDAQTDLNLRVVMCGAGGIGRLERFALEPCQAGNVLKISLTAPHIYLAGAEPSRLVAGHNLKAAYNSWDAGIGFLLR